MTWQWKLVETECVGCGICADLCPHGAITMTCTMAYPEAVQGQCEGCLDCAEQCPVGAIEVGQLATSG